MKKNKKANNKQDPIVRGKTKDILKNPFALATRHASRESLQRKFSIVCALRLRTWSADRYTHRPCPGVGINLQYA